MNLDNFEKLFKVLCNRFNRKFTADFAKTYWDSVNQIPDEPWKDIVKGVIDYERQMPTPGDIKAQWNVWLDTHPGKRMPRQKTPCDVCGGNGYLIFTKYHADYARYYEYIFRCGACLNWKGVVSKSVPEADVLELEDAGYKLDKFWEVEVTEPLKPVAELVKEVVDELPF